MVDSLPRSRLAIAVLLAVLAGYIDGIAFIYLGGYFVSFMSGNTTQSGVELAGGDLAAAGFGFAVIVAFVVGVMAGTAIRSPRRDRGWLVLLGVAVLVAVGAALASAPPVDANAVTGAALVAVVTHRGLPLARDGSREHRLQWQRRALLRHYLYDWRAREDRRGDRGGAPGR